MRGVQLGKRQICRQTFTAPLFAYKDPHCLSQHCSWDFLFLLPPLFPPPLRSNATWLLSLCPPRCLLRVLRKCFYSCINSQAASSLSAPLFFPHFSASAFFWTLFWPKCIGTLGSRITWLMCRFAAKVRALTLSLAAQNRTPIWSWKS